MRSKLRLFGIFVLCAALQLPWAMASQGGEVMRTQVSIEFAYSKDAYTLVATASPGGVITPAGTQTVPAGEDFTFSFTPAAGYHFAGLRIDGVVFPVSANTGAFRFERVLEDHTIYVEFAADPVKATATPALTVTAAPNATSTPARVVVTRVTARPTASPTARADGASRRAGVTVTAVPAQGALEADTVSSWADMPIIDIMPRNLGVSPD